MGEAQPADIAEACVFLASDEARFRTAGILRVDGGVSSMLQVGKPWRSTSASRPMPIRGRATQALADGRAHVAAGDEMTSPAENKAIVVRHFAILNGLDPAGWDEILAEDYIAHHPLTPGVGRERYRTAFAGYASVFSDFATEVHRMIAEDDLVVVRSTSRGRHTGEFMGVAPTGDAFEFSAISIYRIADGKLAEAWYAEDSVGLFQQLGVLPSDIGQFRQFWSATE